MEITFFGAAGTVTGSRYLVREGRTQVLVDCGMFQGLKDLRARNWERPPVDPRHLDAVLLTHAHLDHSGWLPRLVRQGYDGPIHCTAATRDLARLLLPDAGHIQEEDAKYANRKGYSKHQPAEPLYTESDAVTAVQRLAPVGWGEALTVGPLTITFHRMGHILGAAAVRIVGPGGAILFSGDVGRPDDPLMAPPEDPPACDWLVCESTYGDRHHPTGDPIALLGEVVRHTAERGGMVLIPAFAVGRAQAILLGLYRLKRDGAIPRDLPIWLNSPLAIDTTELYLKHRTETKLDEDEIRGMCRVAKVVRTEAESRALNEERGPGVILSASGMLVGGRVLHHLKAFAPEKRNTLLFVGYQAAGTRGGAILAGADTVKVHGEQVPIRCEVARIDAWSAHGDQDDLVGWMSRLPTPPRHVFLTHGEPAASDTLRVRIRDLLGFGVSVPAHQDRYPLIVAPVVERPAAVPRPPAEWPALPPEARTEALRAAPTFQRADEDLAFLDREELRPFRLALEYMKVDLALREARVAGFVTVLGGARIPDPDTAAARRSEAALAAAAAPDDAAAERALEAAERDLVLSTFHAEATSFGRLASSAGRVVATGGGRGIAEAANRGAFEAGVASAGLCVDEPNAFVAPHLCFRFRYPAVRLMHLLQHAQAVVAFPGGLGTLEQLFGALVRMRDGTLPRMPVVLVGRKFWHEVFAGEVLLRRGTAEPSELDGLLWVDTGAEAWEQLRTKLG